LVKILDPTNAVTYLLYRQHCTPLNGVYVKDLTLLGREMKDIILVDVIKKTIFEIMYCNRTHQILSCSSLKTPIILKISLMINQTESFLDWRCSWRILKMLTMSDLSRNIEESSIPHSTPISTRFNINFILTLYRGAKFVKVKNHHVDPDVELNAIQINDPTQKYNKKKEEKERERTYNIETEPDLRRDDREVEFARLAEKNREGMRQYGHLFSKNVPLTERIVVNDRFNFQSSDSSIDIELPSPKECDALINHQGPQEVEGEGDTFFDNNSNSTDSKEREKVGARTRVKVPSLSKSFVELNKRGELVTVPDPTLQGQTVEDVRYMTGVENLNSPLGKQVKIELDNKMVNNNS
jgi:ribosomal protein L34E